MSPLRNGSGRLPAGRGSLPDAGVYGKLTGRPGVCIVTRGPGATHASVGVHTAYQDSTPLILLVGQVASDQEDREAFHEIDYRRMFGPTSGAMGYGVPAAIAAKAVAPDRTVICVAGDGDFLMTGQELATAVQYELPIVVLVVDNGMYGTLRMHQERAFPGRVIGTDLVNPDFAAYARAFGAHGETVEHTAEFPAALEQALNAGHPAVLSLRLDPEAITPRTTLSALRDGR